MTDIVEDCELYAKVIEGVIVVENDWKPGDPERREPRETLLKAAAEIERLRDMCINREEFIAQHNLWKEFSRYLSEPAFIKNDT